MATQYTEATDEWTKGPPTSNSTTVGFRARVNNGVCLFAGARLLYPCLLRISSLRVLMEAIPPSFMHKYNIELNFMILVFPVPVYFGQILLT